MKERHWRCPWRWIRDCSCFDLRHSFLLYVGDALKWRENIVKVRHKTLEDNRETTTLASKEVTTLEVNKEVIISEVKITDSQLKEFNLGRTVQEILLLVTKISVNLSIQKML